MKLKNFGPGLILASSAIGGSHIIASTQAGVKYGVQLALFIIAVNLLKYPFYRFAFQYSLKHDQSVLHGYAEKGRGYLCLFLIFNIFATVVNIAGGALLSAALLAPLLAPFFSVSLTMLSIVLLISYLLILARKQYQVLDWLSKRIMILLTLVTLIAFGMAMSTTGHHSVTLPSPWTLSAVPFLIALMGWMPAPMELSIASSLWVMEKKRQNAQCAKHGLLDFNVGYVVTLLLALVFMGLGALVANQPEQLASGGMFVAQFTNMYALSIGEWTRWFVSLLAFVCIYGTTLTAVDGYSRTNMMAVNLLIKRPNPRPNEVFFWMLGGALVSLVIIVFFRGAVGKMLPFAMTMSFISAPIFAWLNFSLYRHQADANQGVRLWAWLGLLYLVMMIGVYFWV